MHLAPAASLLQQPRHVCLPRPSFAQPPEEPQDIETATPTKVDLPPPLDSYFVFPQCSVNLITCSSNSGKTHFLHQVIRHRQNLFQNEIQRIVTVNGNQRDLTVQHPWSSDTENLEFVSLALDEFDDFANVLQANDLLILDDILQLNKAIEFIIKYGAHHYHLASVFVVTQSCLGSPLYSLIASVHNVVLLFGNSATTRLAQHLVQTFFLCTETKAYLKSIFGLAEKQQDTVVLKLNAIASYRPHSRILALTQVQQLFHSTLPHCLVYPELNHQEDMERETTHRHADMPGFYPHGERLDHAFVLLPASQVKNTETQQEPKEADCAKDKWNEMAMFLESEIESTFPFKKWNAAKNLTRELLRCNDLCISQDFRTVFLRERPKMTFSIVDFLMAACRKNGPGEGPNKVAMYRPLVQVLLKHHVPHTFFINKMMLPSAAAKSARPLPRRHYRHYEDDYY